MAWGKGRDLSTFCFVDKIIDFDKDRSLTASYTLKGNEEFLKDHFSDFPVMPGVLLLEAMKQAASTLLTLSQGAPEAFFRLGSVERVKFGQFVKPGTEIRIEVRFLNQESSFYFFEGQVNLAGGTIQNSRRKALTANFSLSLCGS